VNKDSAVVSQEGKKRIQSEWELEGNSKGTLPLLYLQSRRRTNGR
jgi:hypothetical protein